MTPCPSLPAQPQSVSILYNFHVHSILHVHCISLLTFPMTSCPSLPAQPQEVSTLFSCTFYFTCTLYISPYIPHDTLSITTCTTTACKCSIFMYILQYMYIVYLSPYIPHDTLSITTCTTTGGKYSIFMYIHSILHVHCISLLTFPITPCPSLHAQPQLVSTLFSCTFYFTCTLHISPYIPHDTLSIVTCTTTDCKCSIFMYILFYMYIVYLSSHPP